MNEYLPYIAAYVAAAVVFLAMDFAWFAYSLKNVYEPGMGSLLKDDINVKAAAAFYALYVFGVVFLVVAPNLGLELNTAGLVKVGLTGVVLGLVAYGTYNLTNLAVINGWPLKMTLIDLVWGSVVTAGTSLGAFAAAKLVG